MASDCSGHKLVQHRDGRPPWCDICGGSELSVLNTSLDANSHFAPVQHFDLGYLAKSIVAQYLNEKSINGRLLSPNDIVIVWFCKTLQNWKALLIDPSMIGKYYEVTYDGDLDVSYLDSYTKTDNVCIDVRLT
jgi:hypothetical protein